MNAKIEQFLEEFHPSVRSNIRLGVGITALIAALHGLVFVGLRLVETRLLFQLMTVLQLFHTLLLLLLILMAYNALRAIWLFLRRDELFTGRSAFLALGSVILLGVALFNMPNIFERAVSYEAGRAYRHVYGDAKALCEKWEAEWANKESVQLIIEDEDLGPLEEEAEAYKIAKTIFFNFSRDERDFGLACALKEEPPSDSARAFNYTYRHIEGGMYQFVEQEGKTR